MGTPHTGMKPIQTRYGGCHFRSRLEARWAVFFDALNIRWEYEAEGYEYDRHPDVATWRYLPDFYLPDLGCYVEVKGDTASVTDDYLMMLGHVGHFLPGVHSSHGTTRGLVLLGQIPRPTAPASRYGWSHCHLTHHKGLQVQTLRWSQGSADVWDRELWFPEHGYSSDNFDEHGLPCAHDARKLWNPFPWTGHSSATEAAYSAARSARFEHGESGPT